MSMPFTMLKLDPGNAFGVNGRMQKDTGSEARIVEQYDFAQKDLNEIDVLIIPNFIDQEFLFTQREKITSFLAQKKIVVYCGHLFREWLPGCGPFMPQLIRNFKDYEVFPTAQSTIFEGVTTADMTFKKGVAGFFARGYHHAPANAEILLTFANNKPVTYVDRSSTNGTILVHAGRDLLGYADENKTTDRIRPQFLAWLESEVQALKEEGE
ncbi:hypothetical protein [Lysinibacillus sphaericus]|uniref:hypothetical protein n=1 Tax=Lysinibacillus sphaericus TaxID=1421 RepID=UPI0003A7388F|nr:hypothetical protein [Lysinibacillus sphaericus]